MEQTKILRDYTYSCMSVIENTKFLDNSILDFKNNPTVKNHRELEEAMVQYQKSYREERDRRAFAVSKLLEMKD